MLVFRIAKSAYNRDLSGAGARIYGGRWNHKGTAVIYTSESRSLATLEFLVHAELSYLPHDLHIAALKIPDKIIPEKVTLSALPKNWSTYPPPSMLADIGTQWAQDKHTLLLCVPSAIVENEYNILINPLHSDFARVAVAEVMPFNLDKRLLR